MNLLRNILKHPVKDTVTVFCAALLSLSVLIFIGVLLGRTTAREFFPGHQPNYLLIVARIVVQDFALMSKLILEVSIVVLIAQGIYRLTKK